MKELQCKKSLDWALWAIFTVIFAILFFVLSGNALIVTCQIWIAITSLTIIRAYLFDLLLWGLNNLFAINPTIMKGFRYKMWIQTFGSDKKEMNPFTRIRFHLTAGGIALLMASMFLASKNWTASFMLLVYTHISTLIENMFSVKTFLWILWTLVTWATIVPVFKSWFNAQLPMPWTKKKKKGPDRRFSVLILFGLILLKWIVNCLYFSYSARLVGVTAILKIPYLVMLLFAILFNVLVSSTKARLSS